jgi:hypothetical protein
MMSEIQEFKLQWPWRLEIIPIFSMIVGVIAVIIALFVNQKELNRNTSNIFLSFAVFAILFVLPHGLFYYWFNLDSIELLFLRIVLDFICLVVFIGVDSEYYAALKNGNILVDLYDFFRDYVMLYGIAFYACACLLIFFNLMEDSYYPDVVLTFLAVLILLTAGKLYKDSAK